MLVFLDTEFTDFTRPTLISLALVGEDGREFYAELNDFPRNDCNDFVLAEIIPMLGRIPGSTCDRAELCRRLRAWFEVLPEPATVVFDSPGDGLLLADACLGRLHKAPPAGLGELRQLSSSTIADPVFEVAQKSAYSVDWPPHHALADARALRTGFLAWQTPNTETRRTMKDLFDRDFEFFNDPELLAEALKKPGVDIEERNDTGKSFLTSICLSAYLCPTKNAARIFEILLDAGADPNSKCSAGYSPLRWLAISFTYEPTADFPDQPDLEDAVWDLFDMLIKGGADPEKAGIVGDSSIAPAIRTYVEAWIIGGKPPREEQTQRPSHPSAKREMKLKAAG